MRILSWNLLHKGGASLADVLSLIASQSQDLLLLQEATSAIDGLQNLGGSYIRCLMPGRLNGLAAWSAAGFLHVDTLSLPPGSKWDLRPIRPKWGRPRIALILEASGIQIANVHLDHGQRCNRRQLRHIVQAHPGVDVIMGDFNMVGRTRLAGFADVGPRGVTHMARGFAPFRLDRCLSRRPVSPNSGRALPRGPSDHRPIVIDLPHP
ncbi:endonuclease/exonuclease/phosphatase family protein [Acidisoma cellulosilytica]|uniref:Endonuclease/exonuclease/phosphatase family protein n=1 Tax=Acidisoma cellulosilyticum TaxID=2802395 RepID=A0A964E6X0_9PROT|nr:endonuclease/exonuclease/phosphatase family protein [Acidisoma cellulosilyticum]MCB8883907.1 endonuclease/exonuclease/phosphatase family protein [Acidisoma cellulosilyticum]